MRILQSVPKWAKRIAHGFTNMRLWKKMLLGYVMVILLPSIFFISTYIVQAQDKLYDEFRLNDQRNLQQSYANLKARLKLVEGYSLLFQNNKAVTDYLLGQYQTVSQEMYAFLENIQPLFAFVSTTDAFIQDIAIYTYRMPLVPLSRQVIYVDGDSAIVERMPVAGEWVFDGVGTLAFQKPIFTLQYRRKDAYLSIRMRLMPLLQQYLPADGDSLLFLQKDGAYLAYNDGALVPPVTLDAPEIEAILDRLEQDGLPAGSLIGQYIISDVYMDELDAVLVSLTPTTAVTNTRALWLIIAQLLGLFIILSLLYYLIITALTRRLVRFTHHLDDIDLYTLHEYAQPESRDEIGFLIQTYNEMIVRIRTLVDDLNLAELKKKEAAFHALQAQIRPHFMFNSLETIRMMAESEGNEEVGDAIYNLGNFLRYSMNYQVHSITLASELQNTEHYLVLCKARMQDRLVYEICSDCNAAALQCPSFILQPLVENAILHATRDAHTPLILAIHAVYTEGYYRITVQDNGRGIPPERLTALHDKLAGCSQESPPEPSHNGIGIGNVAERLAGFYGDSASFTIDSTSMVGTTCTITIKEETRT